MREKKEILKSILMLRGIEKDEDIVEFFSSKPQRTYDPFLLLNMEAGVDLLLSEIESGSKICVYGDYDADGITSICIMLTILQLLTHNLIYYIPSRVEEGYGLNNVAIDKLYHDGVNLIVTVDCGSVSYDEVEHAKSLGMKVIVTDHHSIDDTKADCVLINPKQKECQYPFKDIAGCGVAFKFAQAIQNRRGMSRKIIHSVLDFAAIGTIGDIVPLRDENRTIVKYGIASINSGRRKSINALVRAISFQDITAENIAFGIAPHINAAGRMADAKMAVELLMSQDEPDIDIGVSRLVNYNNMRRRVQEDAYNQCLELISGEEPFIILRMDNIHEGIGGIVAGKLKESLYRPVIIVTPSGEGFLKGTGRSIPGVDIYKLLKNHDNLFARFGGHERACGFLMAEERLQEFRQLMDGDMKTIISENPELLNRVQSWDMELDIDSISIELARELMLLEPCGEGNPKPLFYIKDVKPCFLKFMGENGQHLKFSIESPKGGFIDCLYFGRAQEKKQILYEKPSISITGRISLHTWKSNEDVQFIVEEIF